MARQSFTPQNYLRRQNDVNLFWNLGSMPSVSTELTKNGLSSTLSNLIIENDGTVSLQPTSTTADLSDRWESIGSIEIFVKELSIVVRPYGVDIVKPYTWDPINLQEVVDFVTAVRALSPQPVASDFTITLSDEPVPKRQEFSFNYSSSLSSTSDTIYRADTPYPTIDRIFSGSLSRFLRQISIRTFNRNDLQVDVSGSDSGSQNADLFDYFERNAWVRAVLGSASKDINLALQSDRSDPYHFSLPDTDIVDLIKSGNTDPIKVVFAYSQADLDAPVSDIDVTLSQSYSAATASITPTVNVPVDEDVSLSQSYEGATASITVESFVPETPYHRYTIVVGTAFGVTGYWFNNAGSITDATYQLPNGSDAIVRQTMIVGGEIRFVLNQSGLTPADVPEQFPERIVLSRGNTQAICVIKSPDETFTAGQGIGRDYIRQSGDPLTTVLQLSATVNVELFYAQEEAIVEDVSLSQSYEAASASITVTADIPEESKRQKICSTSRTGSNNYSFVGSERIDANYAGTATRYIRSFSIIANRIASLDISNDPNAGAGGADLLPAFETGGWLLLEVGRNFLELDFSRYNDNAEPYRFSSSTNPAIATFAAAIASNTADPLCITFANSREDLREQVLEDVTLSVSYGAATASIAVTSLSFDIDLSVSYGAATSFIKVDRKDPIRRDLSLSQSYDAYAPSITVTRKDPIRRDLSLSQVYEAAVASFARPDIEVPGVEFVSIIATYDAAVASITVIHGAPRDISISAEYEGASSSIEVTYGAHRDVRIEAVYEGSTIELNNVLSVIPGFIYNQIELTYTPGTNPLQDLVGNAIAAFVVNITGIKPESNRQRRSLGASDGLQGPYPKAPDIPAPPMFQQGPPGPPTAPETTPYPAIGDICKLIYRKYRVDDYTVVTGLDFLPEDIDNPRVNVTMRKVRNVTPDAVS